MQLLPRPNRVLKRLQDFGYPFLKALDERYLRHRVTREARSTTNESFALDEWRAAVGAIVDEAVDPMGVWGLRFERRVAAWLAPVALLALCLSLCYRVRRINPAAEWLADPWAMVNPTGVVEKAVAVAWVVASFAAVGAVAFATCVFEGDPRWRAELPEGTGGNGWSLAERIWAFWVYNAGFWGEVLAWLAAAVLAGAWWRMWRIGGGRTVDRHPDVNEHAVGIHTHEMPYN